MSNKVPLFYTTLTALLLLSMPYSAQAAGLVRAFDATIEVRKDGSVLVEELITYDFGEEERHGIFRVIPYSYQATTETYTAPISSVTVSDEKGSPMPFAESRDSGELTVKIGDPDSTVSGVRTYVLTYQVEGPFLFFDDRDELYWNVTGVWPVPIDRASVRVALPHGASVLDAACYAGTVGARDACAVAEKLVGEDRALYRAEASGLNAESGLTVAVAFPPGTIARTAGMRYDTPRPAEYAWPLVLPVLLFVAMALQWYRRGRDPRGAGTIVTEFEPPPSMPPAVAGVLYNERLDMREFTAELVRLAVEGYMRIHRFEEKVLWTFTVTDYLFERLESSREPDAIQRVLLEELFAEKYSGTREADGRVVEGALLSRMKQKFVESKKKVAQAVYEDVALRGLFLVRPDRVRAAYGGAGAVLAIVFGAGAFFAQRELLAIFIVIAAVLSGLTVALWGLLMPVRTRDGVLLLQHLKGFKRYLAVAEKDRLEFHNAPEKTPELFDRLLPYAVAFGVEDAWAKQFADLDMPERSWYAGGGAHFSSIALAHELGSFSSEMASAAAPANSGSSGGGSVGGGFGGGGGGSW